MRGLLQENLSAAPVNGGEPHVWHFAGRIPQDGQREFCVVCGIHRHLPSLKTYDSHGNEVDAMHLMAVWDISKEEEPGEASDTHVWEKKRGAGNVVISKYLHQQMQCVWEVCKICGVCRRRPGERVQYGVSDLTLVDGISCEEIVVRRVLDE